MPVQTIFFDMGGTIDTFWYSSEMRLHATQELQHLLSLAGITLHLSDEQLLKRITHGLEQYHDWRLRTLEEQLPSQVWCKYILSDFPEYAGKLESIGEDLMVWIETHYYQRQMRPEIPAVLSTINDMGYKIGLISNVNSRGQVPLNLQQYGIKHYFNPIVLSSEYRRRKPDPAIFHYAARLSNSPTSECIYIGDRISRDIVGAKRAGFKLAVLIRHEFGHSEPDEGAVPDHTVNDMNEFLAIIEKEHHTSRQSRAQNATSRDIKAVFFDADGVLYYRNNRDQELNPFIKQYGSPCKDDLEPEINDLRHQAFIGHLTFEQYKTAIFKLYGITDPQLISVGLEKALKEKEDIHFFGGTQETLKRLKNRKIYLGIITDTAQPLHVKINKLERGGIGSIWDSITPSSEVGVQKPDPKIYHLAMQQLGIKPSQAVFVGHKTSELEGARNVGMTTIAINQDLDAQADIYIEKIAELANLEILN